MNSERSHAERGHSNLAQQLLHGVVLAPAAPRKMTGRAWARAAVYAGLASLLLGAIALFLAEKETSLRRVLESFLFPKEVHKVVDFFLEYVVRSQTKQVMANALVTLTMMLVSLVLFWAKEKLSRAYEEGAGLGRPEDWTELPWWAELFEEVKLLLLNVALLFLTLWLGHAAEPWRKTAATVLSYAVLFFTWAVDFGAPYLQRRGYKYSQIIGAILRRPILSFSFGAVMALPLAALANLAGASEWPVSLTVAVLFGANVLFILWACVAGTWMGAELVGLAPRVRLPHVGVRVAGWVALLAVIGSGSWVAAQVAGSLRDKSQILKCRYVVDWSSVDLDTPELAALFQGDVTVGVLVNVVITNPNALDVRLEKNRIVASDGSSVVAESHLSPIAVPAGETVRQRMRLDVTVKARSILEGAKLNPLAWDITLYLELDDGLEFPVYLRNGR